MPIMSENSKIKLLSAESIRKIYCENSVIYSSGNIVTYIVDTDETYQEEVDHDESCLSPKTFTPAKSGWTFLGWRENNTADNTVLTSKVMEDDPITLYAVFKQSITLSTIANSVISEQFKDRLYNNGNYADPAFTVSNPTKSGATFKGWSSSASSTTITNSSISNLSLSTSTTRYAVFTYADATVTSTDILKSYEFNFGDETKTIYPLDTTKYASHTVTAKVSYLKTSNNTVGKIVNYAYVDGQLVRSTSNTWRGSYYSSTTGDEEGSYVGSNGASFTMTYAGNLTSRFVLNGYVSGDHDFNGILQITSLKLNGKTVVG